MALLTLCDDREEDLLLAEILLEAGADPNPRYESALEAALNSRSYDLVDLLLEHGADQTRLDKEDQAALESYLSDPEGHRTAKTVQKN